MKLRFQNLLELLKILEEVSGCDVAMGFVVGVSLMAKGGFSRIEGDRHTAGFQPFAVIEQGLEESIGDARRNSLFGGQSTLTAFAERVKTTECQLVSVHQQEQGLIGGGAHGFRQGWAGLVALFRPGRQVDEHPGSRFHSRENRTLAAAAGAQFDGLE